ncbi:hypothetical protein [Amycolatopsis pithecellobii]|uniref:Uncharacterized protein n=1 Tax=Amycolatopsis pithecellobii TaxID=664692 RepID=A0A6N7Z3D3_9PSEU|nr:hypothetical protein [Amycolatopsis pithecellobii]MTD54620.1 hypothetical protein [Amycolatopsis pithecellobii]
MGRDKTLLPDGIPVLGRGRHFAPGTGGCFMEVASVLAGERWSDHPDCTHPMLAEAARLINDQIGDDSRRRLVPWIPEVIGTNKRHPLITAELVAVLARHGLAARPDEAGLHWAARRARSRIAWWESGGWWRRYWLRATDLWFRTHDRVRVPVLIRAMLDSPDEAFVAAFADTVTTYHRTARRLAVERVAGTADATPGPVETVRAASDR